MVKSLLTNHRDIHILEQIRERGGGGGGGNKQRWVIVRKMVLVLIPR